MNRKRKGPPKMEGPDLLGGCDQILTYSKMAKGASRKTAGA